MRLRPIKAVQYVRDRVVKGIRTGGSNVPVDSLSDDQVRFFVRELLREFQTDNNEGRIRNELTRQQPRLDLEAVSTVLKSKSLVVALKKLDAAEVLIPHTSTSESPQLIRSLQNETEYQEDRDVIELEELGSSCSDSMSENNDSAIEEASFSFDVEENITTKTPVNGNYTTGHIQPENTEADEQTSSVENRNIFAHSNSSIVALSGSFGTLPVLNTPAKITVHAPGFTEGINQTTLGGVESFVLPLKYPPPFTVSGTTAVSRVMKKPGPKTAHSKPNQAGLYPCNHCPKFYTTSTARYRHQRSYHNERGQQSHGRKKPKKLVEETVSAFNVSLQWTNLTRKFEKPCEDAGMSSDSSQSSAN